MKKNLQARVKQAEKAKPRRSQSPPWGQVPRMTWTRWKQKKMQMTSASCNRYTQVQRWDRNRATINFRGLTAYGVPAVPASRVLVARSSTKKGAQLRLK